MTIHYVVVADYSTYRIIVKADLNLLIGKFSSVEAIGV